MGEVDCAVCSFACGCRRVFIGHGYRLNCGVEDAKISILGSLYWSKHYACAVLEMFVTGTSEPPHVKKFSDFFALLVADK